MVKLNSLPCPLMKSILPYKNPKTITLISEPLYLPNITITLKSSKKSMPINCPLITHMITKFLWRMVFNLCLDHCTPFLTQSWRN
jgi:hypothetical protein